MTEEEKKKKKQRFELAEVPTQTGIFVKDNEEDTILDDKVVLLNILNAVEDLKNALLK